MEFNFIVRAMEVSGLLVPSASRASRLRLLWFGCSVVLCLALDVCISAHYASELPAVVPSVLMAYYVLSSANSLFRRLYFVFKMKQITELVQFINSSPTSDCEEFDRLEAEMRERSRRKIKVFSTMQFTYEFCSMQSVILTAGIRVVTTVVENLGLHEGVSQPLMSPLAWPREPRKLPTYYLVMLWQCSAFVIGTGVAVTTDAFLCSLMLAAAQRATFLAEVARGSLQPGPQGRVSPAFRAWVRYHQHYLRVVRRINEVMGLFVFVIHAHSCMNIIMYSFAILKIDDEGTRAIVVFTMVGVLIRIFIYATAGQKLLDKSVELGHSVVHVSQVARGGLQRAPFRSSLQVLVTRLSGGAPPEEVSGLGFFKVCFEFFCSVLSASFSYLMVLLNINHEKKDVEIK